MEEPEKPTDDTNPDKAEVKKLDTAESDEPDKPAAPAVTTPVKGKRNIKERLTLLRQAYWRKKKITLPLTLLVLIGVLFAVPYTRFLILGQFISAEYEVIVHDTSTNKPVTEAQVKIGDVAGKTDVNGKAKLKVKVGPAALEVTKKYYKTSTTNILVGLSNKNQSASLKLQATGRQVPVTVVNKLTGKPVSGAVLTAAGTETKTDKDGKAVIVLPAEQKTSEVKIKTAGYNDVSSTVVVTEQADKANTFTVTPSGKVYFLSKLSGKIDVVKTNLDGTERQTVLAGTGKEDNYDTILLASRDWKYLALKSKRDGGNNPKLFLIDTANGDKVTTMDEGNAYFDLVGWAGNRFVYKVDRIGYTYWQPKEQALKSYDATTGKIAVLDETQSVGTGTWDYARNTFANVILLENEVTYTKGWEGYVNMLGGKQASFNSVKPDGSSKRTVKEFPVYLNGTNSFYASPNSRLYEPQGLYVSGHTGGGKDSYFVYEDGKITAKNDLTQAQFDGEYPTWLWSPSGKHTFWADSRDGKNILLTGDGDAENEKQVASLSEYTTYGWYTDDYLLVQKGGSELAIMPAGGGAPSKISDYHKPRTSYASYGGGYGGF